jgi:hypothetical protein
MVNARDAFDECDYASNLEQRAQPRVSDQCAH